MDTKLAVVILSSFVHVSMLLLKHSCSIVGVNEAIQEKKANDIMQVAFMGWFSRTRENLKLNYDHTNLEWTYIEP